MKEAIKRLGQSYIPQWNIDMENPDAGVRLAEIFIRQMEENIKEYRSLRDMMNERLPNLIGISLKPPRPAESLVHIGIAKGAESIWIGSGTKLYGTGVENEKIIFESKKGQYVTDASIKNIFVQRGIRGKISPVSGEFIIENKEGCVSDIYERQEAVLYHSFIFKGDNQIFFIQADDKAFADNVRSGALEICYFSEKGIVPGENLKILHDKIIFQMKLRRTRDDAVLIRKKKAIKNVIKAKKIYIWSAGGEYKPDYIINNIMECNADDFYPFGKTFGMYEECNICHKLCFSKKNSLITVAFDLSFYKSYEGLAEEEEQKRLPLVKRYKRKQNQQTVKNVFPNEILLEYNSPKGWRQITTVEDITSLFAAEWEGRKTVKFYCPSDWGNSEEGENPVLRIRILRADYCYEQPCIYHAPVIRNMKVSYSYDNVMCMPDKIKRICGIDTAYLCNPKDYNREKLLFFQDRDEEELYICLDRRIKDGPVSMYIQRDNKPADTAELIYMYYNGSCFKELVTDSDNAHKVQDGVVIFQVPDDMEKYNYCGIEGFYIKIKKKPFIKEKNYFDNKWRVIMNVLEVWNVDTGTLEDYYAEEIKPGMKVPLGIFDVLKVDLWVDETEEYLKRNSEKNNLASERKIKIEKNERGNIIRVFVLWEETDSFERETHDGRVYILDRAEGNIIFGDGIRQKLPLETKNPVFKAVVYKSSGKKGNIDRGAISSPVSNILFVDNIYNIIPSRGGSDRETVKARQIRADMLIGNHGRLITVKDYYREVISYSDVINKAKIAVDGNKICIYVITEDFREDISSFPIIKKGLGEHLNMLTGIEQGFGGIEIREPVAVEISVELWYRPFNGTDMVFVRQTFDKIMEKYFDPVRGNTGKGWNIGNIPLRQQIGASLGFIRSWGIVEDFSVTMSYEDNGIKKECDIGMAENTDAMVPVSGKHKIHTVRD